MSEKLLNRFNDREAVFDNLQLWKYDTMYNVDLEEDWTPTFSSLIKVNCILSLDF